MSQHTPSSSQAQEESGRPLATNIVLSLLFVLIVYQLFFGVSGSMKKGSDAPSIEITALSQNKKWTPTLQGKQFTVLYFWATWCSACVKGLVYSSNQAERFNRAGTKFLMINIDTEPKVTVDALKYFLQRRGIKKEQLQFHHKDDSLRAANRYKINNLPGMVFIAPDGKVAGTWKGHISDNKLRALLKRYQEEKKKKNV